MTWKASNSKIMISVCYKRILQASLIVIKRLIWLKARQQQIKALEARATLVALKKSFVKKYSVKDLFFIWTGNLHENICSENHHNIMLTWWKAHLSQRVEMVIKNQLHSCETCMPLPPLYTCHRQQYEIITSICFRCVKKEYTVVNKVFGK